MTEEESLELVHGSGNVFRDFGCPDADLRQAKVIMGAEIIKILDEQGLSTRQAEARTGISHSDFSRIRRASFGRFTLDRLVMILGRLGQEVQVSVDVHPRAPREAPASSQPQP